MITIKTKNKNENGYAILELLFYIAFFAILSIVVINSMLIMTRALRETTVQAELLQGGSIMEQISREIRQANSISSVAASDLILNTKDDAGVAKTARFSLSGTDIRFLENNTLTGNLNTPNIMVAALNFTQITTAVGQAVKVVLTVRSTSDRSNRNVSFYDTIVLRGSY